MSSRGPLHVCGGATKAPMFLQMHADCCGRPAIVGENPDAPLLGAAVLPADGRRLRVQHGSCVLQERLLHCLGVQHPLLLAGEGDLEKHGVRVSTRGGSYYSFALVQARLV